MLAEHNSWVQTYKSAVDEIVRNDHNILDAQICFGAVNRATHGPILGELPSSPEIAACIFQEDNTHLFRQVYTFPETPILEDPDSYRYHMNLWAIRCCFFLALLVGLREHGYQARVLSVRRLGQRGRRCRWRTTRDKGYYLNPFFTSLVE